MSERGETAPNAVAEGLQIVPVDDPAMDDEGRPIAVAERNPDAAHAQHRDFAKESKALRGDIRRFANSSPTSRLVVACIAMPTLADFMHSLLNLASAAWKRKQAASTAAGEDKSFRILEAFDGKADKEFAESILHLLGPNAKQWLALHEKHHVNTKTRTLAFKSLSRALSSVYSIVRPKGFPLLIFLLVRDPSFWVELQKKTL